MREYINSNNKMTYFHQGVPRGTPKVYDIICGKYDLKLLCFVI